MLVVLKSFRAAPHNSASRSGERSFAKSRFEKCRNTVCFKLCFLWRGFCAAILPLFHTAKCSESGGEDVRVILSAALCFFLCFFT